MIVKDIIWHFTKEKVVEFFDNMTSVDIVHTVRSLERLRFCDPLDCDLVVLPVEQLDLNKQKIMRLLFIPKAALLTFKPNVHMEGLASIDFDRCAYMRAIFNVATFHPRVYQFRYLDFPEILGAEIIGPPDNLPDIFLEELFSRIKHTRLRVEEESIQLPDEVLAHYSQREQINKIKNIFIRNKLQLYLTIKAAAACIKGSTD